MEAIESARKAIEQIHAKRTAPIDGLPADHAYCVEDRQTWPCATIKALAALGEKP